MPMSKWGGDAAQAWTAAVLERYGRVCWLNLPGCLVVATTGDHVIPRRDRPDLELVVSNGRPACLPCNQRRGATAAPTPTRRDARRFFEAAPAGAADSAGSPPRAAEKFQEETR